MSRLRRLLDVDQLLIFFLLAVTINQMGYFLASFAPAGWGWIGYLQAIAIDLAIWRSAWWYRRYTGRKQRRWALVGVVVFATVSGCYNFGYYTLRAPEMPAALRAGMAAVLPLGVALLSFLYGQKDASRFAVATGERKGSESTSESPRNVAKSPEIMCEGCGRTFAHQNGLNAHKRSCNGKEQS